MPASDRSNGRARADEPDEGVLSKLPRTRPQRATRGRLAARAAVGSDTDAAAAPRTARAVPTSGNGSPRPSDSSRPRTSARTRTGTRAPSSGRTAASTGAPAKAAGARTKAAGAQRKQQRRPASARRASPQLQPAPRQGFASESERPVGPVQPPGGAELLASAAEIVGEVTKAGIAAGERLFRDMLSRLPLS